MTVLYLTPTLLSDTTVSAVIPSDVIAIIQSLRQFIVEDVRSARRFLSKIKHPDPIDRLQFKIHNEHSKKSETLSLLPFLMAENTGFFSESGMPGIADPGKDVVLMAHVNGIKVVPLVGPSSILLALIASGQNGQSFAFAGYLPIKQNERFESIRKLEKRSASERQTQIFIETPYRNMQLLRDIMQCCRDETQLTIAADISGKNEYILTQSIKQWKRNLPELNKIPTVFLLQA